MRRPLRMKRLGGADRPRGTIRAMSQPPRVRSVFCKVSLVADLDGRGERQYNAGTFWHLHCVPDDVTVALDSDPPERRDVAGFWQASAPAGSRCPRCGKLLG